MAITVDWGTGVITVPQADLSFISGTLWSLDTVQFHTDLRILEQGQEGIVFDDTHFGNDEVTIAGTTYVPQVVLINGYSVTFEDGQYAVRLDGTNNNIFDEGIINRNQVSIIPTNSAGLVSGEIAQAVWEYPVYTNYTAEELVRGMASTLLSKLSGAEGTTVSIRDPDDTKDVAVATVDANGNRLSITLDLTN